MSSHPDIFFLLTNNSFILQSTLLTIARALGIPVWQEYFRYLFPINLFRASLSFFGS